MSDAVAEFVDSTAENHPVNEDGTDEGLAERFVGLYGDRFRHIESLRAGKGKWLMWDGTKWSQCTDGEVERHITTMGRKLMIDGAANDDEALLKLGRRARSTNGVSQIRRRIEVHREVITREEDLDRHPHLLPVANGVVDLRTGDLHEPDRLLMLSRGSSVRYEQSAEAPTWERILSECLPGDAGAAFESDLGYMLTGESREHTFWVLYGPLSRNGKSLICETLAEILGPGLAIAVSPGTFLNLRQDDGRSHRSDVMRFRGARIAMTSELPEGVRLNEDLVKRLTGGDTIVARDAYEADEEFLNTASIVMRTNNFPPLDPDSPAIWSRVRLVEFPVSFAGREDKTLSAQLRSESEGILARLVARAVAYYARGELAPNPGDAKRDEIRMSADQLGEVLDRRFVRGPDEMAPVSVTKSIVNDEFVSAGMSSPTRGAGFNDRMAKKGFPIGLRRIDGKPTKVFLGLRIREDEEPAW